MEPRARHDAGRRHLGAIGPAPSPEVLLRAYALGYFPMDRPGAVGPVPFYEADPRALLQPADFRVPRSVRRALRRERYEIRVDGDFAAVTAACAAGRPDVWLTPRLARAYVDLHRAGHAHSVEAWRDGQLAGGLFGVALGGLFTSESMFHRRPDAGNAALVATAAILERAGFVLWDIQMSSSHTRRFGAVEVDGPAYLRRLEAALTVAPGPFEAPASGWSGLGRVSPAGP